MSKGRRLWYLLLASPAVMLAAPAGTIGRYGSRPQIRCQQRLFNGRRNKPLFTLCCFGTCLWKFTTYFAQTSSWKRSKPFKGNASYSANGWAYKGNCLCNMPMLLFLEDERAIAHCATALHDFISTISTILPSFLRSEPKCLSVDNARAAHLICCNPAVSLFAYGFQPLKLLYSSSETGSHHSFEVSVPGTSTAR